MSNIKYNNDNESGVFNNLNSCIGEMKDINNILLNLNIPFDFKYKSILNGLKTDFNKNNYNLIKYKDSLNKYIGEINKDELELLSMLNNIPDNIIGRFDVKE